MGEGGMGERRSVGMRNGGMGRRATDSTGSIGEWGNGGMDSGCLSTYHSSRTRKWQKVNEWLQVFYQYSGTCTCM